ncbi:MAG: NADH dehydrogenase [Acidobacteria bacterium RIFCSPHIGHO2_02_FULL_67_57]|nr:MAG: NADH dehydrogenase [Acidobacteria bacterium RIFCSPHIGHO2_02_FULL_67_57]OFV85366.1 MAG: NADH dehydrogenase [Acidobacteria bacterium RIFCSPHIGHO2_01_FULL_67_28]
MAERTAPPPAAAETMVLNVGPQHPSTHGVLRLILELDGETIVRARPDVGYLHTGIEKSAEKLYYSQVIPLTDRIDYLAPLSNNLVYCLAVEKLLALEVPPRAQWMRVLLTELTRLNNHLVWLGTCALELGAMSVFLYCFREREEILKIFELVSGQRMMTSYFRIGGLAVEPPADFPRQVDRLLKMLPGRFDEYEDLLTENRIWLARTRGVGVLSPEDAIAWGITGPNLRASGIGLDLRKAEPYSSYEKFQFDVPVRPEGDVYARYLVRVAEMRQSVRIARQALDGLPAGPVRADAPGIVLPERDKMKTEMEALIYHFKLVVDGFAPPAGEVYAAVESPKGELGCFLVSDGSPRPWRMRWRPPSLLNVQVLSKLMPGHLFADAIAILASVDFVLGEVDR